jgi:copper chaperone CopZ
MAQRIRFLVPDLWADHHVTKVRKLLVGAPGVASVYASSAFKEVAIDYDPAQTNPDALAQLLAEAGYAPANGHSPQEQQGVVYGEADGMWRERGSRTTNTNPLDNQMTGDFRQY